MASRVRKIAIGGVGVGGSALLAAWFFNDDSYAKVCQGIFHYIFKKLIVMNYIHLRNNLGKWWQPTVSETGQQDLYQQEVNSSNHFKKKSLMS